MPILRDLAIILLALEAAVLTLAILAALALVNYGLFRARWWHAIPCYFSLARKYLNMGIYGIERLCQLVTAPIFAVARLQATVQGMARGAAERVNR